MFLILPQKHNHPNEYLPPSFQREKERKGARRVVEETLPAGAEPQGEAQLRHPPLPVVRDPPPVTVKRTPPCKHTPPHT